MLRFVWLCILVLLAGLASSNAQSPYAGQEAREIKSLSSQEIADYLAGKGMGLARAAELNGYPGPAHVIELAAQLELTAEQRVKTEALFQRMQSNAATLGKELVEEERALDQLFSSRMVNATALEGALSRIGRLQGQLRQVHLQAHLEQTALLTPQQVEKYIQLRGYGAGDGHSGHGNRHH